MKQRDGSAMRTLETFGFGPLPAPPCRLGRAALAVAAVVLAAAPAAAIETLARQAYLVDAATNAVLFEKNAAQLMAPASMSKMMTVYMAFERIKNGSLGLEDTFVVSEDAWRRGGARSGGSTMFLEPGSRVPLESLLRGIIVQSGNDASIVVAEGLAGSEASFADEMTRRARDLGLTDTTFRNATGWPHAEHRTTARDLAVLARRTIERFPELYRYYSEKSFTYNGIRQGNRNPLLYKDIGADGLKTGHTAESGYGLTATAVRNGRRLVLVVSGLPSNKSRARESARLMEWGFREFDNYTLFKAGETVTEADVWLGSAPTVPLVIDDDLTVTLRRKARRGMKVTVTFDGPLAAPIAAGQALAKLTITAPDEASLEVPLVAGADVGRLGLFGRLGAALKFILWGAST
jgi:D-alanyl-D-alanine carboxypeptidase (penicillin-binding protein 5/6)